MIMKFLLLLSFIFSVQMASATNLTDGEITSMVISMSNFSEKSLTKNDIPEITQQLKNILILEDNDPTRSGPFELKKSYPKNKALYRTAMKNFTPQEQQALMEVLNLVEALARNGNG